MRDYRCFISRGSILRLQPRLRFYMHHIPEIADLSQIILLHQSPPPPQKSPQLCNIMPLEVTCALEGVCSGTGTRPLSAAGTYMEQHGRVGGVWPTSLQLPGVGWGVCMGGSTLCLLPPKAWSTRAACYSLPPRWGAKMGYGNQLRLLAAGSVLCWMRAVPFPSDTSADETTHLLLASVTWKYAW